MKKLLLSIALGGMVLTADAQAIKTPAPSPTQMIRQDFGISSVELVYSRPGIKGRKVFGKLVPYGEVWRTGANSATRIKFSDDVSIGGHALKAGEYAIFTIPNEKSWDIIINKGSQNWGTEYHQEDDLFRVTVPSTKLDDAVESFTMNFANVKSGSMDLQIMWDKTLVNVPITADVDKKVMAQIDNAMNKDNHPYFQAAMYYMESGRDMNQALAWLDKAAEQNPKAFWIQYQRANALVRLNRKDEARKAANTSLALAQEAKNMDYVRLNEDLLASLK